MTHETESEQEPVLRPVEPVDQRFDRLAAPLETLGYAASRDEAVARLATRGTRTPDGAASGAADPSSPVPLTTHTPAFDSSGSGPADEPVAAPAADVPEEVSPADVPATDVPVSGVHGASLPVADVPATDVSTASLPAAGLPATDGPTARLPAAGAPATDVPTEGPPAAGVPATDVPTASVPVPDRRAATRWPTALTSPRGVPVWPKLSDGPVAAPPSPVDPVKDPLEPVEPPGSLDPGDRTELLEPVPASAAMEDQPPADVPTETQSLALLDELYEDTDDPPEQAPTVAPRPAPRRTVAIDPAMIPAQPRHRRTPWVLIAVSAMLALTLGLATYLLVATRAHQERSDEWESAARATGADLTQTRSDLEGTVGELAATREQLATAQARITELADEKAQLGDDREVQRQLVDYQERISAAAGKVATALTTCIDGQYQLISYLENAAAYDQADLARFRTDVQTVCGAATDANTALQRELSR